MKTSEPFKGVDAAPVGVRGVRAWLTKHGRKLWWMHSLYALGLGVFVVAFAQKGYEYARWLVLLLLAAWFLLVVTFRLKSAPGAGHLRSTVMNYVLKNLFQAMLFFLLPWYWHSASSGSENIWFVVALGACAILATLDVVFDELLMRRRLLASVYYVMTLFGCLNLTIPAIFMFESITTLFLASGFSALVFWSLLYPIRTLLERKMLILVGVSVGVAMTGAWLARRAIPPVPISVIKGAVGPDVLADGRLKMEIVNLHTTMMTKMIAVTDVGMPTRTADTLVHVWRHEGSIISRTRPKVAALKGGVIRLRSTLAREQVPPERTGEWVVDVETRYGQLIGRTRFNVID